MSGDHTQDYDLKGTIGMNEFGDNKTNREEERGNAALKPNVARAHSASIGELLHRRYDGTLSETLPDSFLSLLKELDRKLPGQTKQ